MIIMSTVDISPLEINYKEMCTWLRNNIDNDYIVNVWSIEFEIEADATFFKLKWGV